MPIPDSSTAPAWRPAPDPGTKLDGPETSSEPPRDPARLLVPQPHDPPGAKPGVNEERTASPSLPVDIPRFAEVKPRVAAGLRPFPDGLDWLKANGYRTVLYVREPGVDDSSDREQIEKKRGLKYVSLEVSPKTLTGQLVDEFNHICSEASNQPLFVYDKEGALAGGLWYLHFRIVDGASDEEARIKAGRLGLKESDDGLHKAMWLAIQSYLEKRKQ